jgi:PAS domain-containing protein
MSGLSTEDAVRGRVDAEGRLIAADPVLAGLHLRAGGREGGILAAPQLAALARLARRLGITISRAAIAADGACDIDFWVRAEPKDEGVDLSVTGWTERPALPAADPASVEREADFLRASADWMWETDEALRITSISTAAAAALGRAPGDLAGERLNRLFTFRESGEAGLPILTALAEQKPFAGQVAEFGANGARYALSGVPLIDGMGRFAGFRGSATATRAAAFAPAEEPPDPPKAPAFGERLDKALRFPLDRIVATAETIGGQPDGPLRQDYATYARDIAAAGRHLLALVDDLIDLQAIERPDFVPEAEAIDLADVARRAAGLLSVRAAARNVRIDRPGEDESLPATGDFTRTLQIMMNLLTNAIRYTPESGAVWIRTEREGDIACLIVADQGKGIAAEDQQRIFDKFERVDANEPGGTGLGLYIARRLARAMGGDIAVDSAPGKGARFTFTLPAR